MTKSQAEEILRNPSFGSQVCIRAVERLRDEPYIQRLRDGLAGKSMACPICNGSPDGCKVCEADGTVEITRVLVDSWEIEVLLGVYDELELKPPKRSA